MSPLLLLACADGPAEAEPAGAATPVVLATCEPFGIAPWQVWPEEALPDVDDRSHQIPGVGAGDFDGDGDLDLLGVLGGGVAALRNDGTGTFALDPTVTVDGGPPSGGTAIAVADLDLDGDLDAWLGRGHGRPDVLLWNDGAFHFTSAELPGTEATPGNGVFADFDGDGDLDLFVAGFVDDLDMFAIADGTQVGAPSRLWRNTGGGAFVEVVGAVPDALAEAICYQATPLDADGDGDLDVYMANDVGPTVPPNALLRNEGDGTFSVADTCYCDLAMHSMGASAGDADGDGDPDLWVSDFGPASLLLNAGDGGFVDATFPTGAYVPLSDDHAAGWGTAFADLDRDGCTDLVVTYGESCANCTEFQDSERQYGQLLFSDCAGGFTRDEPYTPGFDETGRTRSLVVADLDGDGRPDLVTVGKHWVRTWRVTGGCPDGLTVALDGGGTNPAGLGARVVVESAVGANTQWMLPGLAHSTGPAELYFGLGGAPAADRVTVTWPDGGTTAVGPLAPGRHIVSR